MDSSSSATGSQAYLICTTPRSGVHLLFEYLQNSGVAGNPDEYFKPNRVARHRAEFSVQSTEEYVRELLERTSTPNRVFGAKVAWKHLQILLGALRDELDLAESSAVGLLDRVFPRLHYVWLSRRNRVRQAISLARAKHTSLWRSYYQREQPSSPLQFNFDDIHWRVMWLNRVEEEWARFFAENNVSPYILAYEDLIMDPAQRTRELLIDLGLELPASFEFPEPKVQKQADDLTEEWVRNYEAARLLCVSGMHENATR